MSADGTVIAANDYVQSLLGRSAADLVGRSWEELCHARDLIAARDWWVRLRQETRSSSLEIQLRHRDGSLKPVLISGQWLSGPEPHGVLLVLDISKHKTREEQLLAQERHRRNVLIREVHHRIKNNLQGIVGLLQNQALAHPELAETLQTPIRQIDSIALLYDLRSRSRDDGIFLCDLAGVAVRACRKIAPVPVTKDVPHYCNIEVDDNEAVAVALILNELLYNAIKHGSPDNPRVSLCLRREQGQATVTIRNRCRKASQEPNLDQTETLGTGLQLVRSLLPRDGSAILRFYREGDDMIAKLTLRPPVIRLKPDTG